jgi:hypothetical protein
VVKPRDENVRDEYYLTLALREPITGDSMGSLDAYFHTDVIHEQLAELRIGRIFQLYFGCAPSAE